MKKFYRAKLYQKPLKMKPKTNLETFYLGQVIIEDRGKDAVEVVTRLSIDIYDSKSSIKINQKRLSAVGRDIFIKDSSIDYNNPVTEKELSDYVELSASKGFCLRKEMEAKEKERAMQKRKVNKNKEG